MAGIKKLVVGLGNPGRKYDNTRHNVGFAVVAELARRHGQGPAKEAFKGETVEALLGAERTLLLCPHTFMNRSGSSAILARDFYKLEHVGLLVVCDDFNLPLGKLRLRAGGSAGGQKGLDDIIRAFGTQDVPRLRLGIGQPPPHWEGADFVLGRFDKDERPVAGDMVSRAAEAIELWAREGLQAAMARYN